MNTPKNKFESVKFKKVILIISCFAAFCSSSYGASINTTYVGTDSPPSPHTGSAFDSATGKYYRRSYPSNHFFVYNNKADFEANTNYSITTLQDGGTFGTYFEVFNGKFYSRTDTSTSSVSVWDANTGVKVVSNAPIASMGGINGAHTFNWGGYSGVNFMEDADSLYLMGRNFGPGWQINKMDADLNILSTTLYNKDNLGYAFIINNVLFSSDNYYSNTITHSIDLLTGIESAVNFQLLGMGSLYITNVNYVGTDDTLYLHDISGDELYKIENASHAFGVPKSAPENGSTCTLLGVVMVYYALRRRIL